MKKIVILTIISATYLLGITSNAHAAVDCGVVKIKRMLTGPRHGNMMQISNTCGGIQDWICLDPGADHMTREESDRMYAFLLVQYSLDKPIHLSIEENILPAACGANYPGIEDVRTGLQ